MQEKSNTLSSRDFEVVCVTKKTSDDNHGHWHCPITGVAKLIIYREEKFGIEIYRTVVLFQQCEKSRTQPLLNAVVTEGEPLFKEYRLKYIRQGLSGSCIVLAIEKDDDPYGVWELYTFTPTPLKPGEPYKSDEELIAIIRLIAKREILKSSCW